MSAITLPVDIQSAPKVLGQWIFVVLALYSSTLDLRFHWRLFSSISGELFRNYSTFCGVCVCVCACVRVRVSHFSIGTN